MDFKPVIFNAVFVNVNINGKDANVNISTTTLDFISVFKFEDGKWAFFVDVAKPEIKRLGVKSPRFMLLIPQDVVEELWLERVRVRMRKKFGKPAIPHGCEGSMCIAYRLRHDIIAERTWIASAHVTSAGNVVVTLLKPRREPTNFNRLVLAGLTESSNADFDNLWLRVRDAQVLHEAYNEGMIVDGVKWVLLLTSSEAKVDGVYSRHNEPYAPITVTI